MKNVPSFLVTLGLEADADERAIRRAYAQRLKAIDQETDPAAFQTLHEAFEAAGKWARNRAKLASAGDPQESGAPPQEKQAAAETSSGWLAAEPARPESGAAFVDPDSVLIAEEQAPPLPRQAAPVQKPLLEQVDHEATGTLVFKEFGTRFAQGVQEGKFDEEALQQELETTLQDSRLLNLQARASFERGVAGLLVTGWRPGHHLLFDVSAKVFHWMDDKQRLNALGHLGAFLNQAITEYAILVNTSGSALKIRMKLVESLRDIRPPSEQEVATYFKTIETMFARYPNWLRLVTNVQNLAAWRQGAESLAAQVEGNKRKSIADGNKVSGTSIVAIIGVIGMIGMLNTFNSHTPIVQQNAYPPRINSVTYHAPAPALPALDPNLMTGLPSQPLLRLAPVAPLAPVPSLQAIPYNDKQVQQALARIRRNFQFQYSVQDQPIRNDPVTYYIETSPEGKITKMKKMTSSPLPEFDEYVRHAIYRAQPFPTSVDHVSSSAFTIWWKLRRD